MAHGKKKVIRFNELRDNSLFKQPGCRILYMKVGYNKGIPPEGGESILVLPETFIYPSPAEPTYLVREFWRLQKSAAGYRIHPSRYGPSINEIYPDLSRIFTNSVGENFRDEATGEPINERAYETELVWMQNCAFKVG